MITIFLFSAVSLGPVPLIPPSSEHQFPRYKEENSLLLFLFLHLSTSPSPLPPHYLPPLPHHPPPNQYLINYHSSLPSLQTPRSVLRRGPPPHLMATPPSILKMKPSTTNTTTIAEEEEDGGGKDEHTRPEGEEEQPAVPRKIR